MNYFSIDGWPSGTTNICWGRVFGLTVETLRFAIVGAFNSDHDLLKYCAEVVEAAKHCWNSSVSNGSSLLHSWLQLFGVNCTRS